ncbi:DUF302 domain-containing protein [Erythrobacter sp.]|uniref:DUF302 domain-containing protein n=1 Tax=Erythrobacter sp. TaxID=1042 RepID=UPI0025C22EE6|nr:DUF302 domain-containing protein [Erythrobacter sp.]
MSTHLHETFEDAMPQVERALADQGFGIITRIDMSATLQDKLGKDFRPYTILGACNPEAAYAALQLEDKVGTMLPCNVIVQQVHKGLVEVAAIDPVASMQAIDNPDLDRAAHEIRDKLATAINMLGG